MDSRFRFAIEEFAYPVSRSQRSNYHILGNQWLMPSPYNWPIHACAGAKNETDGLFQRFLHQNFENIDIFNDDQNLRMAGLGMFGIETEQDFRSWISESIA